tara:strand:+ start:1881 stop:2420 length:540 start_codon:yes stop_codon:yes gene_type:complete
MVKINLGCGWRNFGSDWHHVDGGEYDHLDSNDIFNLPYEDNSVDLIYASHVIEYFDREEIIPILESWKAKLKPEGILRLGVPNFEVISNLYQNGKYSLDDFLGPLYGRMKMGNQTIYHKTTYDYNSLSNLLYGLKFNEVRRWDWRTTEHSEHDDHSQAYLPHMDKVNGILISLNMEAVK